VSGKRRPTPCGHNLTPCTLLRGVCVAGGRAVSEFLLFAEWNESSEAGPVRQRALVGVYDTHAGAVRGLTEFAGVRRDGLLRGFDIEGGRLTGRVNFAGLISTDPPGGRGIGPL
jgi:hypothetical protein